MDDFFSGEPLTYQRQMRSIQSRNYKRTTPSHSVNNYSYFQYRPPREMSFTDPLQTTVPSPMSFPQRGKLCWRNPSPDNESFDPEQGFQVEVVFVRRPQPGSGRGKKRNTGRRCLDNENKKKRCIIPIKNNDDLCCARAIVTMRAHAHKEDTNDAYQDYRNIIQGRAIQERQARELHHLAGMDPGPCGLEELEKFQAYLKPTYQLLLMCHTKPFFLIFKGPLAPKQIKLLKSDTHYNGFTSFPAFVNRLYWCSLCEKGFNVEDAKNHPCEGRTCQACNRKTCSDYNRDVSPTLVCPNCLYRFYGNDCFDYHREKNQCTKHRTCPKCNTEYNVIKGKRHRVCHLPKL